MRASGARGEGRPGTMGARAFVFARARSRPPAARRPTHLPRVEFFVWGGARRAETEVHVRAQAALPVR